MVMGLNLAQLRGGAAACLERKGQEMSYYVYGIVDPEEVDLTQAPSKEEQLAAVIYVGKGTGNRMDQHLKDAE